MVGTRLLLPAAMHLGFSCALQSLDWLVLRYELLGRPFPHNSRIRGGYYGPGRYRLYPYRSYRKTEINVNRNININTGDINIGDRNTRIGRNERNIYNRKENRKRNVQRPGSGDRVNPKAVKNKPNNVYTDKKGNVHRRTEKGWESRKDGKWSSEKSVSQERVKKHPDSGKSGRIPQDKQKMQPKAKKAPSQLNREHRARERGNVRSKRTMGSRGGRRR